MVGRTVRLLALIALAAVAVGVYLIVHGTVDNHHTVTQTRNGVTPPNTTTGTSIPQAEVLRRQARRHAERDRDADGRSLTELEPLYANVSLTRIPTGKRLRLRR